VPHPDRPSLAEMLEDVLNLTAGAAAALLPLFILAVPGLALLGYVVIPLAAVAAVVALAGLIAAAILTPPYLLARSVRRRTRRGPARSAR
jgi:Flp pilus assembly protein TadB